MVDDPPSTKWTTSTRAKLPRRLPFSYRNELHRVPARVWLGKRREYVRRACTSSLGARPPPTWVCVRDTNRVHECVLFCGGGGGGVGVDFVNYLWEYVSMISQTKI